MFKYIALKFILIKPVPQKEENAFIDYWKTGENDIFMSKLSFPILKQVFKMILKEYKKAIYDQTLVSYNPMEEGYILEHLIYLSFDEGENSFFEKISISK